MTALGGVAFGDFRSCIASRLISGGGVCMDVEVSSVAAVLECKKGSESESHLCHRIMH